MPKVKEEKPKYVVKGKTLTDLAKEVKPLIQKKKKLEGQVEELSSAIHAILVGVVPKIMEDAEQDFVNIPGIGALELSTEVYPYVAGDAIDTFYKWLRERQQGAIIKETIHPKTLQAFVKEQLEAGVDFKDSGCKIGLVPTAKLKAEKKTKKR
jgi:hypothetical protein